VPVSVSVPVLVPESEFRVSVPVSEFPVSARASARASEPADSNRRHS